MVVVKLSRAIAPTAGAVAYSKAMKSSAQPADIRASRTFGTVKKRTITCGKPAVPTINAKVMKNTSTSLLVPLVYAVNPKSTTI